MAKTRLHSSVNQDVWPFANSLFPKDPYGVWLLLACLHFRRGSRRFLTPLPQKQANTKAHTSKEKMEGGITPCTCHLGVNVNLSIAFVVLLQMLQISTRAPPTHDKSFRNIARLKSNYCICFKSVYLFFLFFIPSSDLGQI